MQTTTNYGLKKPEVTDPVDIRVFNDNADILDNELKKRPECTGKAGDMTVEFEQAASRSNLLSGETIKTSFGKIMRFFTDLKAVAFTGSAADLITDEYHRFVSDSEKNGWNAKAGTNTATHNTNGLMSSSDKKKLDGVAAFKGATASAAGGAGLVPAPAAGGQTKYLRADGTWQIPPDTNTWRGIQNNLTSASTTDSLSAAQGKALDQKVRQINANLAKKQDILIHDTYVSTNTTNANGVLTLSIDISSLGLSAKPKCAFLQGQNAGLYSLERYVYSYDNSTASRVVFVLNYGVAKTSITDRYGYVIIP